MLCRAMDTEGNTRLHHLAKRVVEADTPAASMLSSVMAVMAAAGAPVSKPNKEQDTPLHLAARTEALVALRALVLAGADVTARNSKNRWERVQKHVLCVILHLDACTEAQVNADWGPSCGRCGDWCLCDAALCALQTT